MNICVITAAYPYEGSADGVFVREQCRALSRKGHEVAVLAALGRGRIAQGPNFDFIEEDGFNCYASRCFRKATTYFPKTSSRTVLRQIEELFDICYANGRMPDVLYAHFAFPAGYAACELGKSKNLPVVVMEHFSGIAQGTIRKGCARIVSDTITSADSFYCVSDSLKGALDRINPSGKRIDVIPDMISGSFCFITPKKKEEFSFFSLGMLRKIKGFDVLIKAFCSAFSEEENVRLRIGGSGEEEESLQRLIKDSGRGCQIKMLGFLDEAAALREYGECDCFVLASRCETFGIVYREALACGRPVVSTRNGGIEQGWKADFGVLVDVDDVDALAQAMRAIRLSYDRYNLEDISSQIRQMYSPEIIAEEIGEALERVVVRHEEGLS